MTITYATPLFNYVMIVWTQSDHGRVINIDYAYQVTKKNNLSVSNGMLDTRKITAA